MAETTNDAPALVTNAATLDPSGPAGTTPVETFSPSGAPHQVTEFDIDHPAVDANPRANTTAQMNKIDFNDPVKTGAEIAAEGAEPEKSKAKG